MTAYPDRLIEGFKGAIVGFIGCLIAAVAMHNVPYTFLGRLVGRNRRKPKSANSLRNTLRYSAYKMSPLAHHVAALSMPSHIGGRVEIDPNRTWVRASSKQ